MEALLHAQARADFQSDANAPHKLSTTPIYYLLQQYTTIIMASNNYTHMWIRNNDIIKQLNL